MAAWLEGLGLQRARDLVDLPENAALGMTQRVVLPIRHGDVLLGFLWVIVGDQPLTDADRAAIAAYLKAVPPHPNGYPAKVKPGGG